MTVRLKLYRCVWLLLFLGSFLEMQAHVVSQMVAEARLSDDKWSLKVKFDAGYALPETRADVDQEPPSQLWMENLSEDHHSALRYEAVQYLERWFMLKWTGSSELKVKTSFPEWEHQPALFERDFGDGDMAYFRVLYSGEIPKESGVLKISSTGADFPDLVLIIHEESEGESIVTLSEGGAIELLERVELPVEEQSPLSDSGLGFKKTTRGWLSFVIYGFDHVLPKGLDHALFILGLFFLASSWRELLEQSLLFTIGHTCTLLVLVTVTKSVSVTWVEPFIAGTILWIGIENLWAGKVGWNRRLIVLFMGLVHGIGFASVLRGYFENIDRPIVGVLLANVGIELAQLLILAVAGLMLWWARRHTWYQYIRVTASLLIAFAGLGWLLLYLIG